MTLSDLAEYFQQHGVSGGLSVTDELAFLKMYIYTLLLTVSPLSVVLGEAPCRIYSLLHCVTVTTW